MLSASIALDPENRNAMNFVKAMKRFAMNAAMIALNPPWVAMVQS